jgi:hypothetical protein
MVSLAVKEHPTHSIHRNYAAAAATTCVADQITASSFRLRTNGSSRCWANGSQIRWIALAM